ncbi:hypothetical protein CLV52_3511 [Amnibacterium kyonggiense]|uniref:Uncharacterized protein n=1 Tax=Amnibacterium kyonggiense TaxID=595671 RepID=A0A4R7FHW6_9MICO|nr:hypothetical protein CLV52_3511 [Amnibacterium kyonggiense]
MTRRRAADVFVTAERRTTPIDVLFVVSVSLLLAIHLVIFVAVAVLAPVTAAEARGLELVRLPVEVARALVLPFHALLLGSLFVLGRRAAGRWAGFGAMLGVLALDLRSDVVEPVYGPPTAEGGWIAASLLAAGFALVALPRRRVLAGVLVGAASGFFAVAALALPAFLIGIALTSPTPGDRLARGKAAATFAAAWAVPAVGMQIIWLAMLGPDGWAARAAEFTAEFRPHAMLTWLAQTQLLFASWHFPGLVTFSLAMFLFAAAITGVVRYFAIPQHGEHGPAVLRVLQRLPPGLWAAGLTMIFCSIWWGCSGSTLFVLPNLPILAACVPLITALAYRGAKWLLTVNRFWALVAVVYLTGLILARTTQLLITLVQAFHY